MEKVPNTDSGNLDDDIAAEMASPTMIGNSPDSFQESRCASTSTEIYQQVNDINTHNVCEDIDLKPQLLATKGEDLWMDLTSTTCTPSNDADLSRKCVENTNGRCAGTADDVGAVDSIADIEIDIASAVYEYEESSAVRMHSKKECESEPDANVCLLIKVKDKNITEFEKQHHSVDPGPEIDVDCIKIEAVKEEMSDIATLEDQYVSEVNDNQNREKVLHNFKSKTQMKRKSMRLRTDNRVILPNVQQSISHSQESNENRTTCSGCGVMFESQALLKKHKFTCPFTTLQKSDTAFSCPICLVYCSTKNILKRHLRRKHHDMDSFYCMFCKVVVNISPIHDFLEHLQCHLLGNKLMKQPSTISVHQSMDNCPSMMCTLRSEFMCVECNRIVKNKHLLLLHTLAHKINKNLRSISQNSNESDNNNEASTLLDMDLLTLDNYQFTQRNNSSQSNFSFLPSTLTGSSVSPELISTIARSFYVMMFLLQRLQTELTCTGRTGSTTMEDLIKKFKALSSMSLGITEVSNCLEQLLAKPDQSDGNSIHLKITKEHRYEYNQHKVDENYDFVNEIDDEPNVDKDDDSIHSKITEKRESNDRQCMVDDCNIFEEIDITQQKVMGDDAEIYSSEDIDNDDYGDNDYIPKCVTDQVVGAEGRVPTSVKRKSDRKKFENKKYTDFFCVSSDSTLDRHEEVHVIKKTYECIICSKQFQLKNQRQRHYKVHCIEGKFECNSCDYKVKSITAFLKHLANNRDHHANTNTKEMCIDLPSVTCQIKDENLDASVVTKDHRVSGNKDLLNDKIDGNTREMFDHVQPVYSEKKMEGKNDELVDGENKDLFNNRTVDGKGVGINRKKPRKSLKSAKKNLSIKKGFACKINMCDAVFTQYINYLRHKRSHRFEKCYQCPVCPISFNRSDHLKRHLMTHCNKGDHFKCDCCDFTSKERVAFELHFGEHDSERLILKRDKDENQVGNTSVVKAKQKTSSPKKHFVCGECGAVLKHSASYTRHMQQVHWNDKPFKCTMCPMSFVRGYKLKSHMIVHCKKGNEYKCESCDFTTKKNAVMKRHLLNHDRKRNYTCDSCSHKIYIGGERSAGQETGGENVDNDGKQIDNRENSAVTTKQQKKGRTGPSKFIVYCIECGEGFAHPNSHEAKKTLSENSEKRAFQCPVCAKRFQRYQKLKTHIVTHKKDDKYKCEHCDFSINTKSEIMKHIIHNHNPDKSHSCDICGFKTRTTYELEQHKKTTHEPKECKYCSYLAENNSDLQLHARNAHMNIKCPHCNFACFSNVQLKRHIQTHNNDNTKDLIFCELCNFSCCHGRIMKYHMVRHSNSKPLTCPDCDYRCSSRSSMINHKYLHKGIRPYLCSFCGVAFRRVGHLKNHLLIHTKDSKKHACQQCGRKFRAIQNLRMHEMIHTGEKRHKCHACPFACRRNRELAHHLKKHGITTTEKEDRKSLIEDSFKEVIVQQQVE